MESEPAVASTSGASDAAVPRWRSAMSWVAAHRGRLLLAAVLGLVVMIAGGYLLSRQTPGWFRPVDKGDADALATARRIENNIATVLTKVRRAGQEGTPETWSIVVSEEDANAWLRTRMPAWLESECDPPLKWPEDVDAVQVGFRGGRIELGARVIKGEASRVLTASLAPDLREDGSMWIPATWLGVGRLSLPSFVLVGSRGSAGSVPVSMPASVAKMPQVRGVLDVLAGRAPAMPSPLFKIGDGRRVRLIGIDSRDGRLVLTCRTMSKESGR